MKLINILFFLNYFIFLNIIAILQPSITKDIKKKNVQISEKHCKRVKIIKTNKAKFTLNNPVDLENIFIHT